MGALDGFVSDKEEFLLEMLSPTKARDPFLRNRKKIGVNLEVANQIALTIFDGGCEEKVSASKKRAPF